MIPGILTAVNAVEAPFKVLKDFSHLTLSFNDPKSIITKLNFHQLRLSLY
jgi:hypothetical protein